MLDTKKLVCRHGTPSGEIEVIEIESDLFKISILAGRGADLVQLLYKPKNFDLAWQTSTGWPTKKTSVNHPPDVNSFLEGYPGGWQSIFPNGGAPSTHKGISYGQHDEVAMLPWEFRILVETENEISVEFFTFTYKKKFKYEKTFTLKRLIPAVFLDEKVTNLADETVEAMWGNHIAFGEPFLDEYSTIEIAQGINVKPHNQAISVSGRRLNPLKEFLWPVGLSEDNLPLDLSLIPPRKTKSEIVYLETFEDAKYRVKSPTAGLEVTVSWNGKNFPYLWFWQEFGHDSDYPWFGKHFNIGLEPFSSYPTNGLAEAVSNGSALIFTPQEEKTSQLIFEVSETR